MDDNILDNILTDSQLAKAKVIVQDEHPTQISLFLKRDVLENMEPPPHVIRNEDEHGRIVMYGEYQPSVVIRMLRERLENPDF